MREIKKALDPIKRAIALAAGRAVLTALQEGGARQFVQFEALKGEVKDRVERVQQYGFNSVPLAGATVIFLSLNSNRDHPVATNVDDHRYRPTDWKPGDSGMYTFNNCKVHLQADGKTLEIVVDDVVIKATNKVRVESPIFECTGDITDHCDDQGISMREMREIYDGHVHPENDGDGPTNAPNQKMGGGA